MDPTNDPNFTPPSLNPNIEPTAPSSEIPSNAPIQPLVLADMGDPVDAPAPHPSSSSTHLHHHSGGLHSKIPIKHTELIDSNSSSDTEKTVEANSSRSQDILPEPDLILPPTATVQPNQIADLEEVPHGIQRQAKTLEDYQFPTHRFATKLSDESKYPLVIVACGSFSPITYLHLRMFEMALDAINEQTRFEVIGGYYSPVSSNYKKQGLAPAHHRVRICELACERTSSWLMVDAWESLQPKYTRTALVLDHFNDEINTKRGGIVTATGEKRGVKIMLLAGGDLIESMGEPDVWADQDLHHILGKYGCLIVERTGSDVRSFLLSHDIMYEHRRNVLVIKQLIYNDISSTKIRLFIRRGMSVQYLLPNSVIRYIQEHRLYINDTEPVKQVMSDKAD
ncbi:Nicotinamide/nicotinic acid mononucleotide adenylyltransferase 1 [Yamadazyma tenuis]|uniref:Nicotinamide-nucleotide adenylyltransferase n=1 Tax=Candida tenuis (strain ATCC 10573 / BCRC 21748 / CBS 615 / JCM 9827 / NBRC 10315 / NRRL Y-1498 / VKM Y-70) TaxID=590646 RepID=G3B5M0_CANTC|nr:uncharacterized protein CANTEDRAFT_114557 [Yamadazyma tenuis ATCC 10573]XP_006687390.1 uncharacterized protein CANTEDRAFT_114557 [Yamadazyma tenuis ATCC 10573]EGV63596.1 hypothetical protein CANTEDRAFT_114557 [Yamadazyma tenuis ATCC 10573]EGV63597.1 hypothetical protein CANTEDRAFT_114557 [Yamadazyma tenuis ATCC 10573]WEJ96923.1 Nicotinamide/nicotinic acid mononucleotide adenylyltransferase 1 [Yamadazyma tenuis]